MKIFTVTGLTGSGKTTTAVALIKELKRRGYSVGSVKEIHYDAFCLDTEGKNTYLHAEAGSEMVAARAHQETDFLTRGHMPFDELIKHFDTDYVVLEGVRDALAPEIAVCKEGETPALSELTFAVSGRYANNGAKTFNGLPVFDVTDEGEARALADLVIKVTPPLTYEFDEACCNACGKGCRGFMSSYIKGEAALSDCIANSSNIELKIDGRIIPMVPFVQKILANSVKAVVSELKGYTSDSHIEIKMK